MKEEAQRIAILDTLGWVDLHLAPGGLYGRPRVGAAKRPAPDPLNDLNACHEAEKALTDELWPKYRDHLRTAVLGAVRMVSDWCKADIHATASQRAEAFLRTIGKWEESA